jgi:glycosyltransferase involved in cell wall biosynthesis
VRLWDYASAARVDHFVAISHAVAARIGKYYRRESEVIHAPVEVGEYTEPREVEDYYLSVGQLVSYKRVDLAIEACNRLQRPLKIVGVGEGYKSLKRIAGKTITFLGGVSDDEVRKLYSRCRALIFPGEEDFGIVPIEAQAAGRPVIAFGKGGTLETIVGFNPSESPTAEQSTGLFFDRQTVDSLVEAIQRFESLEHQFSPRFIRSHAERFAKANFQQKLAGFIEEKLREHRDPRIAWKHPGFAPAFERKA